jgi:hypothetical protein
LTNQGDDLANFRHRPLFDQYLEQDARSGRGDFGIYLVCVHLQERIEFLDAFAFFFEPAADGDFLYSFTEEGHKDFDGHISSSYQGG